MKNCPKNCIEYVSADCVEYSVTESVFDKLVFIEDELKKITKYFNKSIDGKTLGTGSDLLLTVQKLIDKAVVIPTVTKEKNLNVNLNSLGLPQDSKITQEQLNIILIDQLTSLKNQIGLFNINNNY